MENNIYREAIQYTSSAFAYHEAVFDENGDMVDYIFLDVNQSFEEFTGLSREKIINKSFVRDIALNKAQSGKWVQIYKEVVLENRSIEFVQHSKEFSRYYSIKAYPTGNNRFVTVFNDMTFGKKMQEIARYLIDSMGSDIDYKKITEFVHDVSGADYAAFNLFNTNGENFSTVALYGETSDINRALELLGFDLPSKSWDYDTIREERTKEADIITFSSFHELTGAAIPEDVALTLEKEFELGQVVVARIKKEGKTLGDFTLFFKKGKQLKNRDLLILYTSLLGLYIEKSRLDTELKTHQKMLYTLAEYAPIGFLSCDRTGKITYTNEKLLEIIDSPSAEATKEVNLLTFDKLIESGFSDKLRECMDEDRVITFEMGYTSLWDKNIWVRVHFTPYREKDSVAGANIIVDDISESKRIEEGLKEKANRDPLTRTFNRNVLDTILLDRLNESRDNGYVSCLVLVDIDDFKDINDSKGHGTGDRVLKYLARRIKEELGEKDLIIRTGGDEFLIYLHNIRSREKAKSFVSKVFNKVSSVYRFDDNDDGRSYRLDVSCSMGASFFPEDGDSVESLMREADEALYEVKRKGKKNFLFS